MSEEQKIIDLENEIIFLKDVLSEKQKEIEEKSIIIMAGAEKVKQLEKEIKDLNEIKQQICNEELITQEYVRKNCIKKDKIKELLKSKDIELTGVISYRELQKLLEEN